MRQITKARDDIAAHEQRSERPPFGEPRQVENQKKLFQAIKASKQHQPTVTAASDVRRSAPSIRSKKPSRGAISRSTTCSICNGTMRTSGNLHLQTLPLGKHSNLLLSQPRRAALV